LGVKRIPQLDLLRGVAILMVMANHLPYAAIKWGWIGVDLFFVLSGFLISGLLYNDIKTQGRIRLGRFYFRRGMKIYPSFWAMIGFVVLVSPAIRNGGPVANELLFLQSYAPRIFGHTWSLAVEEHFYILIPLFLALLAYRKSLDAIPWLAPCFILIALVGRIYTASFAPNTEMVAFKSHLRFDSLFCGVALGYLFHFRGELFEKLRRAHFLVLGILLLLPSIFLMPYRPIDVLVYCLSLNAIGFSCIVGWFVNHSSVRFPFVEKIGSYSYCIYLWHVLINNLAFSMLGETWLATLSSVFASLVVGILMSEFIEVPTLKIRERLNGFRFHPASRPEPVAVSTQHLTAST
jgi:peptidoglycan/LPS O-acetylase OafA/YrhL